AGECDRGSGLWILFTSALPNRGSRHGGVGKIQGASARRGFGECASLEALVRRIRPEKKRTKGRKEMIRCSLMATLIVGSLVGQARAEETIKIGFIAPSTGQFSQIGNQMIAGAKYYLHEHGTTVAGKKVELLIRDDGGQPDAAKRIAQEFIVNDKIAALAGFT